MKKYLLPLFLLWQIHAFGLGCIDRTYSSIYFGPDFMKAEEFVTGEFKVGYRAALSAGYIFSPTWRAAVEVNYRKNYLDHDYNYAGIKWKPNLKSESIAGMCNIFCDIYEFYGLIPYIGIGAGYCRTKTTITGQQKFEATQNRAAIQAIFGMMKYVTQHVAVGAEYRFFRFKDKAYDQTAGLTVTYRF